MGFFFRLTRRASVRERVTDFIGGKTGHAF
jgi:hypothetical protein